MQLAELQELKRRFEQERGWHKFPSSLVYTHLVEELGEIGKHILFDEGYKVKGLGHEPTSSLDREFAQVFSLLLQLANRFHIDLEKAFLAELKIMEQRFDKQRWRGYMKRYARRVPAPSNKPS